MTPQENYHPTDKVAETKHRQHREWLRQRTLSRKYAGDLNDEAKEKELGRAVRQAHTEGTKRKFRKSLIEHLEEKGRIGAEEIRAADEIGRCYIAITGELLPRAQQYERTGHSHASPNWPASLTDAVVNRYRPWTDELSNRYKLGGPPIIDVCIGVIVDGQNSDELRHTYHCRRDKVQDWLISGLDLYARWARWV